ncbi:MAG: SulP family inorganic anion transporter [Chlamydiota bacterium]
MKEFFFTWPDLKDYKAAWWKKDLLAAFFVSLLAIPQSIAYSLLADLPPSAGLFSAIFGAIFMGALGSSPYLVSGPTTGIAILLQTAISKVITVYYPAVEGPDKEILTMNILTHLVLLVGTLQILLGFFNVGRFLQFVSRPVILGYFAGIVLAIVVGQLFVFFGIPAPPSGLPVWKKALFFFQNIFHLQPLTTGIGILSLSLLLFIRKQKVPSALFMLLVSTACVFFLFPSVPKLSDIGFLPQLEWKFSFPSLDFELFQQLFTPALAIAFLAILEVFSISRGLSAKSGHHVRSNQDVLALGTTNFFLSFLMGSMPASGSMSRSSLNYQNKAKGRFAAIFSGIFVAILLLVGWPFVQHIPLAALAAILLVMVPTFLEKEEILLCFRATTEDRLVFLLTMGSCLVFSLDIAFFIGIVIAIASYLKKASIPYVVEYAFNAAGHLIVVSPEKQKHRKVRIIGLGGELFFAVVDLFQTTLQTVTKDPYVQVIIIRLNGVHHVDASIVLAIFRVHEYLRATKRHLIISGLTEEVWHIFSKSGIIKKIGEDNFFLSNESQPQLSTWKACLRAQDLLE